MGALRPESRVVPWGGAFTDNLKILLVTPSRTTSAILSARLNQAGFQVKTVPDLTNLTRELNELNISRVIVAAAEVKSCLEIVHSSDEIDRSAIQIIGLVDDPFDKAKVCESGANVCITRLDSAKELAAAIHSVELGDLIPETLKILVVDDSEAARQMASKILSEHRVGSVVLATNGSEAQRLLKDPSCHFDAVLTDQEMPGENGLELCRWIRNESGQKSLPVIFFSDAENPEKIKLIFEAGATDYISKGTIRAELMPRLNNHLKLHQVSRKMVAQIDELTRVNQRIEEFLAVCSHDMRNPLHVISMQSRRLEKALGAEHKIAAESTRRILKSSGYILQLIETLMDAQKSEQRDDLVMEEIDIITLCSDLSDSFQPTAREKNIEFRVTSELEDCPLVTSNGFALRRILGNLLSNAIKFTEPGGSVELQLRLHDQFLDFVVSDSGPGIPEDKISQIFLKYSNQSRLGTTGEKGTGLGLFLSRSLAWKIGGEIYVQSVMGKGSTFSLRIPSKPFGRMNAVA